MQKLSAAAVMKFKNTVERILHVKGNYQGGILELTVAVDQSLNVREVSGLVPQLLKLLKQQGEIFRNVRFNFTVWKNDETMENHVCPMMLAMSESFYQDYRQEMQPKHLEELVEYLKIFHARAKLIILLTDGKYKVRDKENLKAKMQPFLDKKLMVAMVSEEGINIQYREY